MKRGGNDLVSDESQRPTTLCDGFKNPHRKPRFGRTSLSLSTKLVKGLVNHLLKLLSQQIMRWPCAHILKPGHKPAEKGVLGNQTRPHRKMTASLEDREVQLGERHQGKNQLIKHALKTKPVSQLSNSSARQKWLEHGLSNDLLPQCANVS